MEISCISILEDENYTSKITDIISKIKSDHSHFNPHDLWEYTKFQIRNETINYSIKKSKNVKNKKEMLINQISKLEEQISNSTINQENTDTEIQLKTAKINLELNEQKQSYGHYIRSKAFFIEHDQKNSNIFFRIEKQNYEEKHINKLINNTGQEIKESKIPKISDVDNNQLNKDITKNELFESMKIMGKNKTPGTDGLTKEFYEYFWNDVVDILYKSYMFSFNCGFLSIEQRRGIIRLIPKKDKDLVSLKSWRPISLQNVDAKILSQSISRRFQAVLPSIIKNDQNGFKKTIYWFWNQNCSRLH